MNKRGQFYLIAAIIIISVSMGFVVISNSAYTQQNNNIYYLKDEVSIESQKVVSYCLLNSVSSPCNNAQMSNDLNLLATSYMNNPLPYNWYFIYNHSTGNDLILNAYQNFPATVKIYNSQQNIQPKTAYSQNFNVVGNKINISINNYNYTFPIVSNETFYFIISSVEGGQNYTVEGP